MNSTPEKRIPARAPTRNRVNRSSFADPNSSTKRGPDAIDFRAINEAASACLWPVLQRLAPGGRVIAGEYVALNPRRADRRPGSFKIRVHGPRAGVWADFATKDRGGDLVSLCAYVQGCTQTEAARLLNQMLGLATGGRRHG
jgi:hypothetical protein